MRGIPGGLVILGVPPGGPLALPYVIDGGVYAQYMFLQITFGLSSVE